MRSLLTSSMERITFFSIFTSWESFFARSGPKAAADLWRNVWPEKREARSAPGLLRNDAYLAFSPRPSMLRVQGSDLALIHEERWCSQLRENKADTPRGRTEDSDRLRGVLEMLTYRCWTCQRNAQTWWTKKEAVGSGFATL